MTDASSAQLQPFEGYLEALRGVDRDVGYRHVHQYFFDRPSIVAELAERLNVEARLTSEAYRFRHDMPLIAVGSLNGVVLASANPGWRDPAEDARNHSEQLYRAASAPQCHAFAEDFFHVHHQPEVLGKKLRFWSRPIALLGLLGWADVRRAAGCAGSGPPANTTERWHLAHASRLLGGWELLPWHSQSDGFSSRGTPLVRALCEASLEAVLRAGPRVLVVASKTGYDLVRGRLLASEPWENHHVDGVRVSLLRRNDTQVVAVARQLFARGRNFDLQALVSLVGSMK